MTDDTAAAVRIRPVVGWPAQALRGRTYLLTVDVRLEAGESWPYPAEEYEVGCHFSVGPACTVSVLGQAGVILHRFGATYGPAEFLLTAYEETDEVGLALTLVNQRGIPIRRVPLPMRVAAPGEGEHVGTTQTVELSAPHAVRTPTSVSATDDATGVASHPDADGSDTDLHLPKRPEPARPGRRRPSWAQSWRARREQRRLFADYSPELVRRVLDHAAATAGLARTEIIAGYRIDDVIGEGGMGVVYRATHLSLDREVALKLIRPSLALRPDFRARFQRESRSAALVGHPNIVPVFDAGEDDGILYIAMKFVDGIDLAQMLHRTGPLDGTLLVSVIRQIAAALDAAHAHGLVHRDVKPANILLTRNLDHAYLTDFGVAKQFGDDDGLRPSGGWVGTVDYLAPELIDGKEATPRSDIYALAAVLYHGATGAVPFELPSIAAKLRAHASAAPPSAAPAPAALDGVIAQGIAKDPADRFATASELATAAARAFSGDEPERAKPVRHGQAPRDPLAPHSLTPEELRLLLAAEQLGDVFLAWRDRDDFFRVLSLLDREERSWTIGRRTEMDIVIADPQVSGLHARLQLVAGEWAVTDAGLSTNGTFVNEQRVLTRRLADGDRIRIGQTIVVFNGKPLDIAPTRLDKEIEQPTAAQRNVLVALCRPLLEDTQARQPATNKQIANELQLSTGSVKMHLRSIYEKFGIADLRQNQKRLRLAWDAVESGIVGPQDISPDPYRERAARVFLCHSSADTARVRELYRRLADDGFAPWLDVEDLPAGAAWEPAIRMAMRTAEFIVVCLSDAATTRAGYVKKEIKLALDLADRQPEGSIHVIPVRLEDCPVPERLGHLHRVDLFRNEDYARLARMLRARETNVGSM